MSTPGFFSENYLQYKNKQPQSTMSSPTNNNNNNNQQPQPSRTSNKNNNNVAVVHHPVIHQGRDLEPRELNVNFISSPSAVLSPIKSSTNNSNNNNNHHSRSRNDYHQHHSVSPIPAAARHNFLSHLKSNTEPPTPTEDEYGDDEYDDELFVEGITQEDVVLDDDENDNNYQDYDQQDFDDVASASKERQVSQSHQYQNKQQKQQLQQHKRTTSNTTPSSLLQQQQSKSVNRNRSNPKTAVVSGGGVGAQKASNNNNKQQALRRISPQSLPVDQSNQQQQPTSKNTNNNNNNVINVASLNNNNLPIANSKTQTPVEGDSFQQQQRRQQQQHQEQEEEEEAVVTGGSAAQANKPKSRGRGRIIVAVRKRPNDGEGEDCVEIQNPQVLVSATKLRVDLSEYTEQHAYEFDHAFNERMTNLQVYQAVAKPLLDVMFKGGSASCFAFGQTGSGKTWTNFGGASDPGLYILAARDIFQRISSTHRVYVALYEIYCNSLFDLLNSRQVVIAREDGNKRVNVCGLTWHEVSSVKELVEAIDRGTDQRRTGSTSANEFSSRSHAILSLTVRDDQNPKYVGILNIVDLAGSERAADTSSNDRQTRLEGAEINKSLLALKECIRGLDEKKKHIPFRGSKLTEVLRDSFVGNSRTVMIATVSPNQLNAEHTLNTLRYAFRVKGLTVETMAPSKERKMEKMFFAPVGLPPPRTQSNVADQSTTSNVLISGGDGQNHDNNMMDNETQFNNQNLLVGQDGYIRQGNMKRRPHRNDVRRTNSQHQSNVTNSNNNNNQQQEGMISIPGVAVVFPPKATGKTESPTTTNSNNLHQHHQHSTSLIGGNNNNNNSAVGPLDLRVGPIGGAGAASLASLENRMNLQIRELREELKGLRDVKAKDEMKIAELSSMNRELLTRMDELCKLASSNIAASSAAGGNNHGGKGAPVQLPPM